MSGARPTRSPSVEAAGILRFVTSQLQPPMPRTFDATSPSFLSPASAARSAPISWNEVRAHNSATSAWIVVHGDVIDVTGYLESHPGGAKMLLDRAGTDASVDFEALSHGPRARRDLLRLRVGSVETEAACGEGVEPLLSLSATAPTVDVAPGSPLMSPPAPTVALSPSLLETRVSLPRGAGVPRRAGSPHSSLQSSPVHSFGDDIL